MPRKKPEPKRRGRPKAKPLSGEELRLKTLTQMKQAQESRNERIVDGVEETLAELTTHRKELKDKTLEELLALRSEALAIWDTYLTNKEAEEEQLWVGEIPEGYIPPEGMMSPEEWEEIHRAPKPQRKNAKKIHTVMDLPPSKRERYGMATEKQEPPISEEEIKRIEQEFEAKHMEVEMLKRKQEIQMNPPQGKRVRRTEVPKRPPTKSFWV